MIFLIQGKGMSGKSTFYPKKRRKKVFYLLFVDRDPEKKFNQDELVNKEAQVQVVAHLTVHTPKVHPKAGAGIAYVKIQIERHKKFSQKQKAILLIISIQQKKLK